MESKTNIAQDTDSVYMTPVTYDEDFYECIHQEDAVRENTNTDTKNICQENTYEGVKKLCIAVNYPEEKDQQPQQHSTQPASPLLPKRTRVKLLTALTTVTIVLFCAAYLPLKYGEKSKNSDIDENNLSTYITNQVTGYLNTSSEYHTKINTLELVSFISQLNDTKEKSNRKKNTPRKHTTKYGNFQKTIKKLRMTTKSSKRVVDKIKSPNMVTNKLRNTKFKKVIKTKKQSSNKHLLCSKDGNMKYDDVDYTKFITTNKLKKNKKIDKFKTKLPPIQINVINNKLWLQSGFKLYFDVHNKNGDYLRRVKIRCVNIRQTYTGHIVASKEFTSDNTPIVIYSSALKHLSDFKVMHEVDDISIHGCQFSAVNCFTGEITTYRYFPSEPEWKFHSSLILNRRMHLLTECRCLIHNNIYFAGLVDMVFDLFQFSKKGMFLNKIRVRECPRLLGIDRNGWLLVHHHCDTERPFDSRLSVYNQTSLKLHKDLKDNEIYGLKTVLDDESNIWVLREDCIIKYTV